MVDQEPVEGERFGGVAGIGDEAGDGPGLLGMGGGIGQHGPVPVDDRAAGLVRAGPLTTEVGVGKTWLEAH